MTKILNPLIVVGTGSTNQALGVTGGYISTNDLRFSSGISYSTGSFNTSVINSSTGKIETIQSGVIYWDHSHGSTISIQPNWHNSVVVVNTESYLFTVNDSSVTSLNNFQFTIMKNDSDIGVITGPTFEYSGSTNSSALVRQNQSILYKWSLDYGNWISEVLDNGIVHSMTTLANISSDYSHVMEYPIVDINDTTQKSINYTEGSFASDWLSGTIYSSFRPINIGSAGSLFNLNPSEYIGNTTIPAFGLVQGKLLRVSLSGTISVSTIPAYLDITFSMGGVALVNSTFSILTSTNNNTGWCINYVMKAGDVGINGSVRTDGVWTSGDLNGVVNIFDYYNWGSTINTTVDNTIDATYSSFESDLTICHSTIERLS